MWLLHLGTDDDDTDDDDTYLNMGETTTTTTSYDDTSTLDTNNNITIDTTSVYLCTVMGLSLSSSRIDGNTLLKPILHETKMNILATTTTTTQ